MSVIAAALKHMLASGMPHDAIVEAVAEMEVNLASAERNALEKRRAADRERQAKHRAGNVMSRDKRDKRDIAPSPKKPPLEPPKNTPHPPVSVSERARARVESDWPEDFKEQAWAAYGKKVDRSASLAKLDEVRRSGTVTWPELLAGIVRQAGNVEPQFRPSLERWLKRKKWADEFPVGPPPSESRSVNGSRYPPAKAPTVHDVARRLEAEHNTGVWDDDEPKMFGGYGNQADPYPPRLLS